MFTYIVLIIADAVVSALIASLFWQPRQCEKCGTWHSYDAIRYGHKCVDYCDECKKAKDRWEGWPTLWWISFLIGLVIILSVTR